MGGRGPVELLIGLCIFFPALSPLQRSARYFCSTFCFSKDDQIPHTQLPEGIAQYASSVKNPDAGSIGDDARDFIQIKCTFFLTSFLAKGFLALNNR